MKFLKIIARRIKEKVTKGIHITNISMFKGFLGLAGF